MLGVRENGVEVTVRRLEVVSRVVRARHGDSS
jgi:hypothetical protein